MMFTRIKRVTDPLNDDVKARIVGRDRVSVADDDDVTSPSLSELFYGFDAGDFFPMIGDSSTDRETSMSDSSNANRVADDLIAPIVQSMQSDAFGNLLSAHVSKAAQMFSCARSGNKQAAAMRRNVMAYLRNCGYNAAICKTKWESSGGLTAGEHEFIDVIRTENCSSARYFVDLDFAAEFEIARPADFYERLARQFPAIFVGTSDDLKQILEVVSDAARRSLKSSGLHMPPWRKHRFMQNKWLGPFRRTANVFQASFSSSTLPPKQLGYGVKCRAVGFDGAINGGFLLFPVPSHSRTR